MERLGCKTLETATSYRQWYDATSAEKHEAWSGDQVGLVKGWVPSDQWEQRRGPG